MKSVTRAESCYFTAIYIRRILTLVAIHGEDFIGWPEITLRNVCLTWAAHMKAARPKDIACWPQDANLLFKKNGSRAMNWRDADSATVKWFGTKTCQASFSSPMPLKRVRPSHVPGSRQYDLFLMLDAYVTMVADKMPIKAVLSKKQSHRHWKGFFLSTRSKRFMGVTMVRKVIQQEMVAAGIDRKFTPGCVRGNTGSTMWFLGRQAGIPNLTKGSIADITCHKHASTFENHYERAPSDEAALALATYRPKNKLKQMRLEELLCLGVQS
jgi:hypothetical protein